jgi:hypothetical protein
VFPITKREKGTQFGFRNLILTLTNITVNVRKREEETEEGIVGEVEWEEGIET